MPVTNKGAPLGARSRSPSPELAACTGWAIETTSVKALDGNKYEVSGKFTMKGISKDLTATATLKYLPHKPELDEIMPNANFVIEGYVDP